MEKKHFRFEEQLNSMALKINLEILIRISKFKYNNLAIMTYLLEKKPDKDFRFLFFNNGIYLLDYIYFQV